MVRVLLVTLTIDSGVLALAIGPEVSIFKGNHRARIVVHDMDIIGVKFRDGLTRSRHLVYRRNRRGEDSEQPG